MASVEAEAKQEAADIFADLVNELMQSDTRINAAAQKEARAYMRARSTDSTAAPTSNVTATTKSATLRGHNHVSRGVQPLSSSGSTPTAVADKVSALANSLHQRRGSATAAATDGPTAAPTAGLTHRNSLRTRHRL